ncbi:MAG: ATP-binding cassette domain-containing protein [Pseudomonadota bacterium]
MSYVLVDNVFHRYGHQPVLERINIEAEEGTFLSLVGESGCGKSTFLRLMLAQEVPSRGNIRIAGQPPAMEPGRERGVVYQRYSVFPHLSVRDNLVAAEAFATTRFGAFYGREKRAARDRADEILTRIGLGHVAGGWPSSLSGGQQQRLAIAQALLARPRVLMLDEPFGALDPGTKAQMHDFLLDQKAEHGMTIFMVTHDLSEGFKLGDRVLVFDKVRHDPDAPSAYGATITYDLDARQSDRAPESRGDTTLYSRAHSAQRTAISSGEPPAG